MKNNEKKGYIKKQFKKIYTNLNVKSIDGKNI